MEPLRHNNLCVHGWKTINSRIHRLPEVALLQEVVSPFLTVINNKWLLCYGIDFVRHSLFCLVQLCIVFSRNHCNSCVQMCGLVTADIHFQWLLQLFQSLFLWWSLCLEEGVSLKCTICRLEPLTILFFCTLTSCWSLLITHWKRSFSNDGWEMYKLLAMRVSTRGKIIAKLT